MTTIKMNVAGGTPGGGAGTNIGGASTDINGKYVNLCKVLDLSLKTLVNRGTNKINKGHYRQYDLKLSQEEYRKVSSV